MTMSAHAGPSDRVWFYVIVAFVGLNVVDIGMTLRLVSLGAVELNPVMASALAAGPAWAIVFKGSMTLGVTAGLWLGRRHHVVRQAGLAFVGVLAVLAGYELINMWLV